MYLPKKFFVFSNLDCMSQILILNEKCAWDQIISCRSGVSPPLGERAEHTVSTHILLCKMKQEVHSISLRDFQNSKIKRKDIIDIFIAARSEGSLPTGPKPERKASSTSSSSARARDIAPTSGTSSMASKPSLMQKCRQWHRRWNRNWMRQNVKKFSFISFI